LRTSHFHAVIQRVREHLKQVLDLWLNEQVEGQGLVLRPIFYGSKVGDDDLAAFAKGYAAMLSGKSYHEVTQSGGGVFEDDGEREAVRQVSAHLLETQLKAAEDWLDSKFETAALVIKAIYHEEGAKLAEIRGKEARQGLKEARQRLEELDPLLKLVAKLWDELN